MKKYGSYILFFLIGFVLVMVGSGKNSEYKDAAASGYKVEAVITSVDSNIKTDTAGDLVTEYTYYGDYELNGIHYTNVTLKKDTYAEYQVGDTCSLVVNPKTPDKEMDGGFFFSFFGVLLMGWTVYEVIKAKKERKKNSLAE